MMRERNNLFSFSTSGNPPPQHHKKILLAKIPANIANKDALFNHIAPKMHFPDYFGKNWDALWDFLNDFYWLETIQTVIISHTDLPLEDQNTTDLKKYLAILNDAISAWNKRSTGAIKTLQVFFPEKYKDKITKLIEENYDEKMKDAIVW